MKREVKQFETYLKGRLAELDQKREDPNPEIALPAEGGYAELFHIYEHVLPILEGKTK